MRKKFEANRKNENEKKRNGENDNKLSKSGQRSLAGAKERAFNLKRAPAPSQILSRNILETNTHNFGQKSIFIDIFSCAVE